MKDTFRGWCFTINNYTEDDINVVETIKCAYIVYGYEVGDQGTPHIQGYIYFTNGKSMSAVSKLLKRAHLKIARGGPDDNYDYCSKEGNFYTRGDKPIQGKRNDIKIALEIINTTGKVVDVIDQVHSYQAVRFAELAIKYKEKKRSEKPFVQWFYGVTGSGKTKLAFEILPDAYVCMSSARWFEGYDAHSDVIIDDMRKDFCKFHELLRLLDRYPVRVEMKGGSRQFLATNIIITSAFHPADLFDTNEDLAQLLRRIDEIREFKKE